MLFGFGQTQRKMLEELLQNKDGMTIDEFVQHLNITRTAVNQHINSLEKEGYVRKHSQSRTGGRPSQIFALSEKGINLFPKQYAWFSELLLSSLKDELGSQHLENMLSNLGVKIAQTYDRQLHDMSDTEKLQAIASTMQDLGYSSKVDNENSISACNCVYHDLARENPEICAFDLALMSAMSGRKVKHTECMVRGGSKCRFSFNEHFSDTYTNYYLKLEE